MQPLLALYFPRSLLCLVFALPSIPSATAVRRRLECPTLVRRVSGSLGLQRSRFAASTCAVCQTSFQLTASARACVSHFCPGQTSRKWITNLPKHGAAQFNTSSAGIPLLGNTHTGGISGIRHLLEQQYRRRQQLGSAPLEVGR